jgi:tetratricopeptide (TPR) repeat protein
MDKFLLLKKILIFFITSIWLFLTGCATTYYSRGQKALEQERYGDAIRELKQAIAENPKDILAIRDLGIAVYSKGNLNLSLRLLNIARMRVPEDPVTSYYIGRIYEDSGDYAKAIDMYKNYINLSPLNPFRQEIENRLLALTRQLLLKNLRDMLTREAQLETATLPDSAVAVLYFLNLNKAEALTPLQKGITEMMITDLSQVKSLALVERARLQMLMQEMGLGMSGLVDETTSPRLGKLLGVSRIVHGGMVQLSDKQIRLNAGYTDVKNGKNSSPVTITGSLNDLFKLEKDLVFKILEDMAIQLTPEERKAIEKPPTRNLLAFMYYCKALDQEDKGLYDQAAVNYNAALKKDPGFAPAERGVQRVHAYSQFKTKAPLPSLAVVSAKTNRAAGNKSRTAGRPQASQRRAALQGRSVPGLSLGSRLERTALNVNAGFMPGIQSREAVTEENTTSFGASSPILIRIPIPVKQ